MDSVFGVLYYIIKTRQYIRERGDVMDTKKLKLIAIISMFIDHLPRIMSLEMWEVIAGNIALLFPDKEEFINALIIDKIPVFMSYIGRLAAPIFMFCVTVGFRYTKDIKKYILRVFLFALISQIPYILFMQAEEYASGLSKFEITPFYEISLNIMFTLGLGLVALYFYEKLKDNIMIIRLIPIVVTALTAHSIRMEGGYAYIIYIFMFYVLRDISILKKAFIWIFVIIICRLPLIYNLLQITDDLSRIMPTLRMNILGVYAGVFITFFFNNKKIVISKAFKYIMYWFYPVHLMLLYFLYLLSRTAF